MPGDKRAEAYDRPKPACQARAPSVTVRHANLDWGAVCALSDEACSPASVLGLQPGDVDPRLRQPLSEVISARSDGRGAERPADRPTQGQGREQRNGEGEGGERVDRQARYEEPGAG